MPRCADDYPLVPRSVLRSEAPSYAVALCNLQRRLHEAVATWNQCDAAAEAVCWARVLEARARLSTFLADARRAAS